MTDMRMRVDGRAVALFVVLDLVTFIVLYWLVMPSFAEVLAVMEPTLATSIGWVLSATRLGLVAVVAARSYRRRRGLQHRSELLPTMVVAGLSAWGVQLVLGILGRVATGMPPWSALMLVDLLAWLGFALVGVLFVAPGEPERLPLRYQQMRGERSASR